MESILGRKRRWRVGEMEKERERDRRGNESNEGKDGRTY